MYTIEQIKNMVAAESNIRADKILKRGDSRALRNHTKYVESASAYIDAIGEITDIELANQHIDVFKNETLSVRTMVQMTSVIFEKMM